MLQNNPELRSKIEQLWNKFWSGGISNPLTAIEQITYLLFMKRLDELDQRLRQALNNRLGHERLRLIGLRTRLRAQAPTARLRSARQQLRALALRQNATLRQCFQTARQHLQNLSGALHALSPLATLRRGYAIVRRYPDGTIVRRADQLQIGDPMEALLGSGRVRCAITAIDVENRAPSSAVGTDPEEP